MGDIFVNALLTILGISIGVGPIGSFVLWKRLSYFGDTIAHSALLGVSLAIMTGLNHIVAILCVSLLSSFVLLKRSQVYTEDTLLNVISNFSMALGLIVLSVFSLSETSLSSILFGDILAVSYHDIALIYFVTVLLLLIVLFRWKKWLLVAINKDLAIVAKLNVALLELEFSIVLSILIAVSINVVGALLITALLTIPAAAARVLINTPKQMVIMSSLICLLSSLCGLLVSFQFNFPTGPSMIVLSVAFLGLANLYSSIRVAR